MRLLDHGEEDQRCQKPAKTLPTNQPPGGSDARCGQFFDAETLDAGDLLPECLLADHLRAQLDSDAVAAVTLNRITLPRR